MIITTTLLLRCLIDLPVFCLIIVVVVVEEEEKDDDDDVDVGIDSCALFLSSVASCWSSIRRTPPYRNQRR